eukprot:tig00001590_g9384.t1
MPVLTVTRYLERAEFWVRPTAASGSAAGSRPATGGAATANARAVPLKALLPASGLVRRDEGPDAPSGASRAGARAPRTCRAAVTVQERLAFIGENRGRLAGMAKNREGSLSLQAFVEESPDARVASALCLDLLPAIEELAMDQFANYLVWKLFKELDEKSVRAAGAARRGAPATGRAGPRPARPLHSPLPRDRLQYPPAPPRPAPPAGARSRAGLDRRGRRFGSPCLCRVADHLRSEKQVDAFLAGLRKCCPALFDDPHAAHLLQHAARSFVPEKKAFMYAEARGRVPTLAASKARPPPAPPAPPRARLGLAERQREALLAELWPAAPALAADPHGAPSCPAPPRSARRWPRRAQLQALVAVKERPVLRPLAAALHGSLLRLALSPRAAPLLEKLLKCGDAAAAGSIARELLPLAPQLAKAVELARAVAARGPSTSPRLPLASSPAPAPAAPIASPAPASAAPAHAASSSTSSAVAARTAPIPASAPSSAIAPAAATGGAQGLPSASVVAVPPPPGKSRPARPVSQPGALAGPRGASAGLPASRSKRGSGPGSICGGGSSGPHRAACPAPTDGGGCGGTWRRTLYRSAGSARIGGSSDGGSSGGAGKCQCGGVRAVRGVAGGALGGSGGEARRRLRTRPAPPLRPRPARPPRLRFPSRFAPDAPAPAPGPALPRIRPRPRPAPPPPRPRPAPAPPPPPPPPSRNLPRRRRPQQRLPLRGPAGGPAAPRGQRASRRAASRTAHRPAKAAQPLAAPPPAAPVPAAGAGAASTRLRLAAAPFAGNAPAGPSGYAQGYGPAPPQVYAAAHAAHQHPAQAFPGPQYGVQMLPGPQHQAGYQATTGYPAGAGYPVSAAGYPAAAGYPTTAGYPAMAGYPATAGYGFQQHVVPRVYPYPQQQQPTTVPRVPVVGPVPPRAAVAQTGAGAAPATCPICGALLPSADNAQLNAHIDACLARAGS